MIRYDARWCVSKDTETKRPGLPGTCGHVVHLGQNLCDALSVSLDQNAETSELLMSRYTEALTCLSQRAMARNCCAMAMTHSNEVTNHVSQPCLTDSNGGGHDP